MKPPKNFYSNLDRRKQGLPEVPEASAADAGKIIKVGDSGAYELGNDSGSDLPVPSAASNGKTLVVSNGNYAFSDFASYSILATSSSGTISSAKSTGIRVLTGETIRYYLNGLSRSVNGILSDGNVLMPSDLYIEDASGIYNGIVVSLQSSIKGIVSDLEGKIYYADCSVNSVILTPIGSVRYYEITASGSSVSLPSGVTFAEVYALLQAGVDIKFTSGARVYSVTSFESTNIRAHWMTDLDLTSMEVYVINLASDGTGTVASATFSGS